MFNIVNQDNGKGGSKAKNNQEHGGYIENGKVFSVTSGPIGDPSVNAPLPIIINSDGSTFHSHASGTKRIQETDPNTLDVIKSTLHIWKQHPSNADIRTSTNTDYVFAMRDKKVYIYNSKGIQTSVPMRSFIRPNKK